MKRIKIDSALALVISLDIWRLQRKGLRNKIKNGNLVSVIFLFVTLPFGK